ncbi:MAG: hypothetical protein M3273_02760 [Actinomycetota bacterium]|nr:hypothetical protein [Actinomycetota bacterium]
MGSSLAIVAAASLLAFSSLAEQAGLQGLATAGLQPAPPARGVTRAITLPGTAPASPREPREPVAQLIPEALSEPPETVAAPVVEPPPSEPAGPRPDPKPRRDRRAQDDKMEPRRELADLARSSASRDEDAGHGRHVRPKKHKEHRGEVFVARSHAEPAKGRGNGRLEHDHGNGNGKGRSKHDRSNGKGKGHDKHEHANGKGKGHSKHGH